jgi:hypothetical protein
MDSRVFCVGSNPISRNYYTETVGLYNSNVSRINSILDLTAERFVVLLQFEKRGEERLVNGLLT